MTSSAAAKQITKKEAGWVALWALVVVLLYAVSGCLGVRALRASKADVESHRRAFLQEESIDGAPIPALGPPGVVHDVQIGAYVNRIGEVSVHDGTWTEDCDLWFRWHDDAIKPGETFRVVNGEVTQREKVDARASEGSYYERYRIKVRLTKSFDAVRFPFGDEGLGLQVEDGAADAQSVRYVADTQSSGVDHRGVAPSLTIKESLAVVKYIADASTRGEPNAAAGAPHVHSRFVFVTLVSAPSWALHVRNFQALFAAVAVALIACFIKPTHVDARFGLGIGAFFAATTNNLMTAGSLPVLGQFTLTAMVNAVGLGTLFLTLVQSAVALHLLGTLGRAKLVRLFDRVAVLVFLLGYATLNILLPLAAGS